MRRKIIEIVLEIILASVGRAEVARENLFQIKEKTGADMNHHNHFGLAEQ